MRSTEVTVKTDAFRFVSIFGSSATELKAYKLKISFTLIEQNKIRKFHKNQTNQKTNLGGGKPLGTQHARG